MCAVIIDVNRPTIKINHEKENNRKNVKLSKKEKLGKREDELIFNVLKCCKSIQFKQTTCTCTRTTFKNQKTKDNFVITAGKIIFQNER